MRLRVLAIAVVAMLAGCSEAPVELEQEPPTFKDAKATDTTGAIKGVVVNDTIVPVNGATVSLNTGETFETGPDGAFVFNDLAPGVYFVTARAPNHGEAQTSADVVAGSAGDSLRLMIPFTPPPVPTVQELTYKFVTSAAGWVVGVGGIVFTDLVGEGHFANNFEIAANSSWVQGELVWTPQQPGATEMRIDSTLGNGEWSQRQVRAGPSALLAIWDDETIATKDTMNLGSSIWAYSAGNGIPAGLVVTQEAEWFVHSFQHWTPPSDWRFTEDGGLTPP